MFIVKLYCSLVIATCIESIDGVNCCLSYLTVVKKNVAVRLWYVSFFKYFIFDTKKLF